MVGSVSYESQLLGNRSICLFKARLQNNGLVVNLASPFS